MPRKKQPLDFEQSLASLESIVSRMEQGDLSLEESLAAFEEGIKLTRECQSILDNAEQKVQVLSVENNQLKTEPFILEQE
ncbi:exodeoxyribonuclease VII small subunit [Neptunomonas concharum]|uniref:Exodeoxyribonuclease 7 small subunit n=1 Tax=Neptunomonas concharum TaxID=1031538 RepID=A0A5P1R7E7_9GAMM|nr:exodeoxyribonuclease VII small subunit [Neptunomonas concharum]QEQ95564.1 exodeoxyribonuclease VII small subunit [Neptunomonas concharum]